MNRRRALWAAVAAIGAWSEGAVGQRASAPDAEPCAVTGEATDTDLDGLRVRAGPGFERAELGRLYPGMDPEVAFHDANPSLAEGLIGAQFTIDRLSGDWVHITDIDPITDGIDPIGGEGPRLNFQGEGWVHASRVRVLPAERAVPRVAPDEGSAMAEGLWNPYAPSTRVVGCRGRWAHLQNLPAGAADRTAGGASAWLSSQSNARHAEIMRNSLRPEGDPR